MEYQSFQSMAPMPSQVASNGLSTGNRAGCDTYYDAHTMSRLYEVFLIAMVTCSILMLVSLFELTPEIHSGCGFLLKSVFGDMAYLMPVLMFYGSSMIYLYWKRPFQSGHSLILKLWGASMIYFSLEAMGQGGELGHAFARSFFESQHPATAWIVAIAVFIAGLFMMTNLSCLDIGSGLVELVSEFFRKKESRCYTVDNDYRSTTTALSSRHEPNLISYEKSFSEPHIHDQQANQLINCLQHFDIRAIVSHKIPGPVVTRFELHIAPGVKSSAVCSRHKEIARYLRVEEVRVLEVIAGKSCIGIEIPNAQREIFHFSDLSYALDQSDHEPLPLLLGKTTTGDTKIIDLDSMPHLLIAGSTKSGKTMLLQSVLMSLTHRLSSDELKLILIDPKFLSFSQWKNAPHLLHDIVTDSDSAINALNWCVDEMERRYQLMASDNHARFPKIIVVVDEFADLIMTHKNEVETAIARLAQKAQQSGIHLILSTQRPTVDIVTGHIKTNIPVRIALSVPDRRDSRIILDDQGAESLLGKGDMLLKMHGKTCERLHAPYVSENEIREHVARLKNNNSNIEEIVVESSSQKVNRLSNVTPLNIMPPDKISFRKREKKSVDECFDEAVSFVKETGAASISRIQRKFKIGYGRAANIIDAMENQGIVAKRESQHGSRAVIEATS